MFKLYEEIRDRIADQAAVTDGWTIKLTDGRTFKQYVGCRWVEAV